MVNYEKKHLYMMGAIAVLILAPFYILVGPFIFQGIMFDDVSVWLLQTPMTAYGMYGISVLMLALGLGFSSFFVKRAVYFTGLGLIFAGVLFVMGTFSYKSLSTEEIAWGEPFSFKTNSYSWEDVKEVILVSPPTEEEKHKMVFYFNDGKEVTFVRNNEFQAEFSNFNTAKRQYKFPFKASE